MDTTASSFTARNNAKRAAEKMIANGKAPAVNYGIRPRDDGRFEIVWKTAPTTGEVEAEIATAATAAEDGHYNTNPRFSVNEDPSDAPPNAGAEEAAAATGNEPAASSAPASGAPELNRPLPVGVSGQIIGLLGSSPNSTHPAASIRRGCTATCCVIACTSRNVRSSGQLA